MPFVSFAWCQRLARLVANATQQRVNPESPLLSASLPSGERIQIVIPPATGPHCVAISIRRPSSDIWSIEDLAARGMIELAGDYARATDGLLAQAQAFHSAKDRALEELHAKHAFERA